MTFDASPSKDVRHWKPARSSLSINARNSTYLDSDWMSVFHSRLLNRQSRIRNLTIIIYLTNAFVYLVEVFHNAGSTRREQGCDETQWISPQTTKSPVWQVNFLDIYLKFYYNLL